MTNVLIRAPCSSILNHHIYSSISSDRVLVAGTASTPHHERWTKLIYPGCKWFPNPVSNFVPHVILNTRKKCTAKIFLASHSSSPLLVTEPLSFFTQQRASSVSITTDGYVGMIADRFEFLSTSGGVQAYSVMGQNRFFEAMEEVSVKKIG